jgi:hypothetical protein
MLTIRLRQVEKKGLHMILENTIDERELLVIHPLDDVAEQKIETRHLGAMRMTPAVRVSLLALRGYLVLMTLLVLYHVLDLAGVLGKG